MSFVWRLIMIVIVIVIGIAAAPARADEQSISRLAQEVTFHIEKGPVEFALIQFSRQADVQVVLASNAALNVTASPVIGRFAADAALAGLLKGTGLVYVIVGNTVTVVTNEKTNRDFLGDLDE
jgi:hypothetical protein